MNYYDTIASGYNELYGEEQREKLRKIIKEVLIQKNDRVLDVGCGTGIAAGYFTRIVGIDPALEMLKAARFPVVYGGADALPFQDGSFDVVLSVTMLHHIADVEGALREMRRVVRANGKVIMGVLKKAEKYEQIAEQIRLFFTVREVDLGKDIVFISNA